MQQYVSWIVKIKTICEKKKSSLQSFSVSTIKGIIHFEINF